MHWVGFVAVMLWPTLASAQAHCDGDLCGEKLIASGWRKLASCDGHAWSYLLGKDDKVLFCRGISGAAGPVEFPCRDFRGDVEKYRRLAAVLREIGQDDCWAIAEEAGGGN
jgi:hypothetical protein